MDTQSGECPLAIIRKHLAVMNFAVIRAKVEEITVSIRLMPVLGNKTAGTLLNKTLLLAFR